MVLISRQRTCQDGVTRSRTLYFATRLTQVFRFRRIWLRFPIPSHHPSSIWCTLWRGLDIGLLELSVARLFGAVIAKSTARLYCLGYARYQRFCVSAHVLPFPTSERILYLFIASLDDAQLPHATIKCYLSSVRHFQIFHGLVNRSLPHSRDWSSCYEESRSQKRRQFVLDACPLRQKCSKSFVTTGLQGLQILTW